MADTGAAASDRRARFDFAQDDRVNHNSSRRFRDVTTRQRHTEMVGESEKAFHEFVFEIGFPSLARQTE